MSKASEHDNRMRIIERDPGMLHDYNLITVMFPDLGPFTVSARTLQLFRMESPTLRGNASG